MTKKVNYLSLILLYVIPIFLLLTGVSCTGIEEDPCTNAPDVSEVNINLQTEQLGRELMSSSSPEEIGTFLNNNPEVAEKYLLSGRYPNDSILVNELYQRVTNASFDTLYNETVQEYGDFSAKSTEFKQAFQYIKHYYPNFRPPKIKTIVTGFLHMDRDLYVDDSLIVCGLDFYLKDSARFRPNIYMYMLKRIRPPYLVPSSMLLFSGSFNESDLEDNTLIAEMIYYGKSYYFVDHVLPCTPDTLMTGYSEEEMLMLENSEKSLWQYFVEKDILFSNNVFEKRKYVNDRPEIVEIAPGVPGRVGRWIGWQIVKSYMRNHPEVTLPELMATRDAQKIFKEAGYRPK
jgi:hypothetical protein